MPKKAIRAPRPRRPPLKQAPSQHGGLRVSVVPWGTGPEELHAASRAVLRHPQLRRVLRRTRHRLLYAELVEPEADVKGRRTPVASKRFRATVFDYSNNRALLVDGRLDDREAVVITESGRQPAPSRDEFEEAVQVLMQDPELGPKLREQQVQPHLTMPLLVNTELLDGRLERTLAVALLPRDERGRAEVVGVNLIRQSVIRYEGGAPEGAGTPGELCEPPDWLDPHTDQAPGQVRVTVTQGGKVLWRFYVLRPAATMGPGISTNGTGVELRFVDYRGKRVLYRAHVPILNVKYNNDACGPFRDWQWEEGIFQADGTDPAPGFRLCATPPETVLTSTKPDQQKDQGNFRGVAIYVDGQEVVLVSEMQAAWYRYISEWRLHADGTILPRFAFTTVKYWCPCNIHHHHVYWRFDFDIRTAGNNVVHEYNDPPLFPPSNWHVKTYEIKRPRDPARKRKWRVAHTQSGEGYEVIPGADDGIATASADWPFPRGDVWILRYHGGEIDDGSHYVGPPYEAGIDAWVNGEPINDHDVVIWYAAHFTHDISKTIGEVVGPTLKPFNWQKRG